MKTVLIVDDERPARELLKMSINWEALGFAAPIEASNGKAALAQYLACQPSFVITDIQMPVMDGLELISAIKDINPAQRIVILSCHESFLFAQRAMKLGVVDYLIKDALNINALADILLSDDEKQEQADDSSSECNGILSCAARGDALPDEAENHLSTLISGARKYFCAAVSVGKNTLAYSSSAQLNEDAAALFAGNLGGDMYFGSDNRIYFLLLTPCGVSTMENLNASTRILHELRAMLCQNFADPITIGVSAVTDNAMLLKKKLLEAETALSSYVFFGKGKNIHYDAAQRDTQVSSIKSLEKRTASIKAAIETGDGSTVRNEVTLLYQKDLPGILQYNYLQHVNTLLLSSLAEKCFSQNIPFKDVFGTEMLSELPTNGSCDTAEEMLNWYLERFENYFSFIQAQKEYAQSPRAQKVKQYIDKNYNADISLETVAEKFGLHKVYLAKVFKMSVGCSVNDYIRTVKVEHAKELLANKDLRTNTIIEMLNFNSPQTFYNMFKHCAGISPKEYREQILAEKRDREK